MNFLGACRSLHASSSAGDLVHRLHSRNSVRSGCMFLDHSANHVLHDVSLQPTASGIPFLLESNKIGAAGSESAKRSRIVWTLSRMAVTLLMPWLAPSFASASLARTRAESMAVVSCWFKEAMHRTPSSTLRRRLQLPHSRTCISIIPAFPSSVVSGVTLAPVGFPIERPC